MQWVTKVMAAACLQLLHGTSHMHAWARQMCCGIRRILASCWIPIGNLACDHQPCQAAQGCSSLTMIQ